MLKVSLMMYLSTINNLMSDSFISGCVKYPNVLLVYNKL